MSDYLSVLKEIAAESQDSVMVNVSGKEFPLIKPTKYAYWQLMMHSGEFNHVEVAVKTVKLFLPDGLTEDEVFNIMNVDGFFKGDGEIFQAFEKFNKALNSDKAFDAGNSPDADQDF